VVDVDDFDDTDFGHIISKEFKKMISAPYSSRNATKRY
jgi:hypothetical protein